MFESWRAGIVSLLPKPSNTNECFDEVKYRANQCSPELDEKAVFTMYALEYLSTRWGKLSAE